MKGKHENLGAFHSRSILCLAEIIYRYDPSLRPFNNGDRAGSFGNNSPHENGSSITRTVLAQVVPANAAKIQSETNSTKQKKEPTPKAASQFQVTMNILCPNEPPICSGGLISQHATADELNAWEIKNKIQFPLTCRYQQPPRCRIGHTSNCSQRCTP